MASVASEANKTRRTRKQTLAEPEESELHGLFLDFIEAAVATILEGALERNVSLCAVPQNVANARGTGRRDQGEQSRCSKRL